MIKQFIFYFLNYKLTGISPQPTHDNRSSLQHYTKLLKKRSIMLIKRGQYNFHNSSAISIYYSWCRWNFEACSDLRRDTISQWLLQDKYNCGEANVAWWMGRSRRLMLARITLLESSCCILQKQYPSNESLFADSTNMDVWFKVN